MLTFYRNELPRNRKSNFWCFRNRNKKIERNISLQIAVLTILVATKINVSPESAQSKKKSEKKRKKKIHIYIYSGNRKKYALKIFSKTPLFITKSMLVNMFIVRGSENADQ